MKGEMVVRHARLSNLQGAKKKEGKRENPKILSVNTNGSEASNLPAKSGRTFIMCPLCKGDHRLGVCSSWCLNRGHTGKECQSKIRCNVSKCGGRHHAPFMVSPF